MNARREEICMRCKMSMKFYEKDFPSCNQPCYPIDEDEWKQLGVKPEDDITPEKLELMMEISTRPYCMERMLEAHPIQWWYGRIGR